MSKDIMGQLSRLISILTLLKSKRLITGNEIAERFDVSLRTIYRDIRKLEEAGVPIITEEGKGYSIMEGYFVTPAPFQQEEVNALITAEKLVAKTKNNALIENFGAALTKIKSTFRSKLQVKSELLEAKMLMIPNSKAKEHSNSLSAIQLAMTNFYMVKIKYQKEDEEKSEREIEPAAIYGYDDLWIVIAWCHLRNDYRNFRLDRILEFKILNKRFEDRQFDIRKYFTSCPEFQMDP